MAEPIQFKLHVDTTEADSTFREIESLLARLDERCEKAEQLIRQLDERSTP